MELFQTTVIIFRRKAVCLKFGRVAVSASKKIYITTILNSFMTETDIIYKTIHWFAEQINGLVSIW